ncbi:hypothetical protein [Tessaracoccus sp.]
MTDLSAPDVRKTMRSLAHAYDAVPSSWLRRVVRVNFEVRQRVSDAATEALTILGDQPGAFAFQARESLGALARTAEGTDVRGGTERDQMVTAADAVARTLARIVLAD